MIKGKLFCITGSLENFSTKKAAYEEIAKRGGHATKNINVACNYLVLGAKGSPNYSLAAKGNKQCRAEELIERGCDIKIISEEMLLALLEFSEELAISEWGSNTSKQPPVEKQTIGALEITKSIAIPKNNVRQVLRIRYETSPLDRNDADVIRLQTKKIAKSILAKNLPTHSIRTSLTPAEWQIGWSAGENEQVIPEDNQLILFCRVAALLDTPERQTTIESSVDTFVDELNANGFAGTVSIRVWDEFSSLGKKELNRLFKALKKNN